jgi:hypothetical protein
MRETGILLVTAMTNTFEKALEEVRARIAMLLHQRDQLNAEIARMQATEIGLRNVIGQQIQAEIAWTDVVRSVVNLSRGRPMSAVEVRDTLAAWGYKFEGIKNPLAFFNNILQRLSDQGELVRSDSGRPFRFRSS